MNFICFLTVNSARLFVWSPRKRSLMFLKEEETVSFFSLRNSFDRLTTDDHRPKKHRNLLENRFDHYQNNSHPNKRLETRPKTTKQLFRHVAKSKVSIEDFRSFLWLNFPEFFVKLSFFSSKFSRFSRRHRDNFELRRVFWIFCIPLLSKKKFEENFNEQFAFTSSKTKDLFFTFVPEIIKTNDEISSIVRRSNYQVW